MNGSFNKQKSILPRVLAGIVALIIFVGVLNLFQSQIKNSFYFVFSPVQKVFWRAGDSASGFLGALLNSANLQKLNDGLKLENEKLLTEIISLQDLKTENQALKDAILCNADKNFNLILSDVTGLDSNNDFILINKGSDDGIKENMPVINQQKALFGKVFQVYKNFSRVMLISNKNSVLDVKIQAGDSNQQPVYGAVKGSGNLNVFLDLVLLGSQIKEGDVLITSALEGIFPKDLLVGKIVKKSENDLKPFQTAEIEPFFDVKNLDKLFVITDYRQEN